MLCLYKNGENLDYSFKSDWHIGRREGVQQLLPPKPDCADVEDHGKKVPRAFQPLMGKPKKINRDLLAKPHLLEAVKKCPFFDKPEFKAYFDLHEEIINEVIPCDEFQLIKLIWAGMDPESKEFS